MTELAEWQDPDNDGYPTDSYFETVTDALEKRGITVEEWWRDEPWDVTYRLGDNDRLHYAELYISWRVDEESSPLTDEWQPLQSGMCGWYWVPYSDSQKALGDFSEDLGLAILAAPDTVADAITKLVRPAQPTCPRGPAMTLHDTHAIPTTDEPTTSRLSDRFAEIREDRSAYWPLASSAQSRAFELADDAGRSEGARPIVEALRVADRLADHVQDLAAENEKLRAELAALKQIPVQTAAPGVGVRAGQVLLYTPCPCCGLSHETGLAPDRARSLAATITNHADHIAPA